MSPTLVTTGGALLDNVVAADGHVARGQIGGNALYSAAAAALWLDGVATVARVPSNYPVSTLSEGVSGRFDLSGLHRDAAAVTLEEWFIYDLTGERTDQIHASPARADEMGLRPGPVPRERIDDFVTAARTDPEAGVGYSHFRRHHPIEPAIVPDHFWAAQAMHLAPNLPEAQLAMARAARGHGLLLSCDPGHFVSGMDRAFLDALLPLVDIFCPSATELAALYTDLPPEAAIQDLAGRTRGLAAVKQGARGAMIAGLPGATEPVHVPACSAQPVDLTGAGDAWCGGLMAGLVLGEAPVAAAHRAAVSAAIAVETRGPVALAQIARSVALNRLGAAT